MTFSRSAGQGSYWNADAMVIGLVFHRLGRRHGRDPAEDQITEGVGAAFPDQPPVAAAPVGDAL